MSRRRSRPAHVLAPVLTLMLLAGGTAAAAPTGPRVVPLDQVAVTTQLLASGLTRPIAIAGLPDGRLLINEKAGTVRVYHPASGLAPAPVLNLTDRVNSVGERGLLGIVPAPDFAQSNRVYVAYTSQPSGTLTLSRVPLGAPGQEQILLTQEHAAFTNHNGGQLAFGPDGYLYWVLGDGGGAGDPQNNALNLGTLLGKILRIDVSTACAPLAYCVPADNPFVGVAGVRPEIWLSGLRNAWRFSFDPGDGSLWIGDVGQGTREEVDHLGPDDGGANLGWSCREGSLVFNQARCDPNTVYTDPIFEYDNSSQGCAVIGGFVYRGRAFGDLTGPTYVASDYCSRTAWAIRANTDGTYTSGTIGTFPAQPTSFGTDANGELYLVNDQGQLHQVIFQWAPN
jgi:glucose/arabinose dehydrogenase